MAHIHKWEADWAWDQVLVSFFKFNSYSANGDQYDGGYEGCKKHGEGIYTYADLARKERRKYENGKLLESTLLQDKEWIALTKDGG